MTISDEKLSAFLDNELSRSDMEEIRQALAEDETLADRLALLSRVDEAVKGYASQIDSTPVPAKLQSLLTDNDTVVSMSSWKGSAWQAARQKVREHVALAAGVALLIGVGVGQILPTGDQQSGENQWVHVGVALSNTLSGQTATLANGDELQPYFSFTAGDGRLCRSYAVRGEYTRDEIACRSGGQWHPVASAYRDMAGAGEYAAASASQLMNVTLSTLDGSAALSIEEERLQLKEDAQ